MRSSAYLIGLVLLSAALLGACAKQDPPTINLYRAIHAGDLDQIKRHLHHGTDINQPDRNGETPLQVAAVQGNPVVTRLLVEHGAELETRNRDGRTALEEAVLAGKIQVARLLLKQGAVLDAQDMLFQAIGTHADFRDLYEFLQARGADMNAPNTLGVTPMLAAIAAQDRLVVKRLIDQGADVNLRGANELAPLAAAVQAGNQDIVRLLKRNGAVENP